MQPGLFSGNRQRGAPYLSFPRRHRCFVAARPCSHGVFEPLRASAKQKRGTNGASTAPDRAFAVRWLRPDRRPRRGGSGFDWLPARIVQTAGVAGRRVLRRLLPRLLRGRRGHDDDHDVFRDEPVVRRAARALVLSGECPVAGPISASALDAALPARARGLGPPGATWAGGASGHDNLRLDRLRPGLAALCLVVAERDGLVAGERLFVRRVVLPLCCGVAAAAEVDHRCRLRAADRSLGMAGRGAPSGPDLPTDAGPGSVSPVPAADLRRLCVDALDGTDDHAGPDRRLLGADRLLPGRSLVQGGAVRAAIRRAIRPLPAKRTLLAATGRRGEPLSRSLTMF